MYHFKGPTKDTYFNDVIESGILFDGIKSRKIRFGNAEKNKKEFESKISSVRIGGNKLEKQLNGIEKITKFYKSREEATKLCIDYFKMVHKAAIFYSKHGKKLKIFTP